MSRIIMLNPTGINAGLTSISLGIIYVAEQNGISLSIFKPIVQLPGNDSESDQTISIIRKNFNLSINKPLNISYVELLLSNNQRDMIIEEIVAQYHFYNKNTDVVLIEGLMPTNEHQFAQSLNYEIAKALNAEVVLLISQNNYTPEQIKKHIKLTCNNFGSGLYTNIAGVIINKLNAPINNDSHTCSDFYSPSIFDMSYNNQLLKTDLSELTKNIHMPILGAIPWNGDLIATRVIDILHHLNATVINEGDINIRRVKSIVLYTQNILYILKYLSKDSLLVIYTNCLDKLLAACLSASKGKSVAAILLVGNLDINITIIGNLCKQIFVQELPILLVNNITIWKLLQSLQHFNLRIPTDDYERIKKIQKYIANYINVTWIKSLTKTIKRVHSFSPPAFRYYLTDLARKAKKHIVLPEGSEPRTIKAANICMERGIATCVLLGNPSEINNIAISNGIKLNSDIKIIDPEIIRENYVDRLVELRKNKGMTKLTAREQLKDNVVLGTLMLENNEVDGLVSGAVHTTANTIRPSLQLIKTAPGNSLISSVFFMLLPEQVYIYGDCAINTNPTAEQLAEIAIQSAKSAIAFGIDPRVAMLSYSTKNSGTGSDVEKVYKATILAQEQYPNLVIDGPLQYDAAVVTNVAKFKAPDSPVAGQANVFIFPDLNAGNITYKAVQRSVNSISIGPMLQGMRKPVNDLSRGAKVADIVYTIALTVIQATHR